MQQRLTDAQWSLGMVLVWITYRSEEAVISLKGKWTPTSAAIRDLLSALRSGKLSAHGMVKLRSFDDFSIPAAPRFFDSLALVLYRARDVVPDEQKSENTQSAEAF